MLKLEVVDLFCGAGGTSTGAANAVRRLGYNPAVTAINHWDVAVSSHRSNHPEMRHLCANIDSLNPRDLFRGRRLDLLLGSPECTHHSRARGGRPKDDQSRATAHCVTRWADALRPKTILVENVREWQDWGPLDGDGFPVHDRKGETFRAWLALLESLGYAVEHRVLCAADYGDPTVRQRLFVQAQAPGRRIVWPKQTHSKDGSVPGTLPWRSAGEIVNRDHPMESAFSRRSKGGGPLKESTMRRIAHGLVRYVVAPMLAEGRLDGDLEEVYYCIPQQAGHVSRSLGLPLQTVTGKGAEALVKTWLVHVIGSREEGSSRSLRDPVPTVVSKQHAALCEAYLVQAGRTGAPRVRPVKDRRVAASKQRIPVPLPDLKEWTVRMRGSPDKAFTAGGVDEPFPTLTAGGSHIGLCELVEVFQEEDCFLVQVGPLEMRFRVNFRMFQPDELAAAQGFPAGYRFEGTKEDQVKQIGNAVPCGLAEALVYAAMNQ